MLSIAGSPKGAIKLVQDASCLTDADKLRAARTEAGGVKFDWETHKREKILLPLVLFGRRPTSAFDSCLLSLALNRSKKPHNCDCTLKTNYIYTDSRLVNIT